MPGKHSRIRLSSPFPVCASGGQWTSEFRYDHSVYTYSLHIVYAEKRADNRRVIFGELFQSELFWRVIFMQIRLLKVMNSGSLQSQLSSNT